MRKISILFFNSVFGLDGLFGLDARFGSESIEIPEMVPEHIIGGETTPDLGSKNF